MNTLVAILQDPAVAAAIGSLITGALVHFAHVRHLDVHANNAALASDVTHAALDLVESTQGKFVDHVPALLHDAEHIVGDFRGGQPEPISAADAWKQQAQANNQTVAK